MTFEHRCIVLETRGLVRRGVVNSEVVEKEMQTLGQQGFELVSVVPISDGSVGTTRIALFFKRAKV